MEYDLIETPENVELEQRLAGIGTRFLAGLLDTLLIILILLIGLVVVVTIEGWGWLRDLTGWGLGIALFFIGAFLLHWGYFVLFELGTNGQSPGKRYMKIRVVKEGGGPITFSEVAIRNLLRAVDGTPLYPVAGITMFCTAKCQRLGDLAAGTVVVSEELQDYSASADRPRNVQWAAEVSPEALRSTRLTPEEFRLLSSYQARRQELTVEARARVLARLLPPIMARLGRPLDSSSFDAMDMQVEELLEHREPGTPEIFQQENPQ